MTRVVAIALAAGLASVPMARGQAEMPLVTSSAWRGWYAAELASRLAACPRERGTTYYFSQSGDDQTGDGTAASPWKSLAKARQVLSASAGDIALLFRRGDVWREPIGIDAFQPNVTIGDWGEGEKPLLTAFESVGSPAAWEPAPGLANTYRRAIVGPVRWVKEDDDLDRPYSRRSHPAGVSAVEGSWHFDGTWLYVHPRHGPGGVATDPRTDGKSYECVRPRGSGVIVRGDGSRIENIRAQGWGMTEQLGTQQHGIESRALGGARVAIVGCESHYGLAHVMTHFTDQGGVVTFADCKAGLTMFVAFGGETMFNTYAFYGGNDTIFDRCVATHGTLPSDDHDTTRRWGMGFYGHTNGGLGQIMGRTIAAGCRVRDTAYGCASPSNFDHLPPAGALADVRCVIIDETFEGGVGTGQHFQVGVRDAARVNGRYLNVSPPPLPALALASWRSGGWVINCVLDLDVTRQTENYFALFNSSPGSPNNPRFWHCDVRVRSRPLMTFKFDFDEPNLSPQAEMVNSVFVQTGGGVAYPNIGSSPGVGGLERERSRGLLHNAYLNIVPSAVAHDPGRVLLSSEPVRSSPGCTSVLACRAGPLPGGLALGFDLSGEVADRNDLGAFESPPCGNCDGSPGPLNINDYMCFLQRYAAGDPRANCDQSTIPPVLNVTDFACFQSAFAAGCR
ncbi:MAG: hypothetical protein JNM80_12275 [Phycisphaerae bacterium]|nr:hypothetical protein [Phycisphaerae bacterium]